MLLQETSRALRLRLGCQFRFQSPQPTPSIFLVHPDASECRVIEEHWESEQFSPYHDYRDLYGNLCRRTTVPAGGSVVRYDVVVGTSPDPDPTAPDALEHLPGDLPDDVLLYTLPSRYCHSDVLAGQAFDLFGTSPPGWSRVQAICDWVHERIEFSYGTSTVATTALDVLENGRGVCRDFTHLAMTFCRALNMPASAPPP